MGVEPNYTVAEIERRWLVRFDAVDLLDKPYREIEDLYISDTRLRLRRVENMEGRVDFKLCKKYGKRSTLSELITNLYLSEQEYRLLAQLEGRTVRKRRYTLEGGALDLYPGEPPIAVFEVEFASEAEAQQYSPPPFVGEEITDNGVYSGAALAARIVLTAREGGGT